MASSTRLPKVATQFPREDILPVLCALNDKLGSIRDVALSQGSEQLKRSALNVLGAALGERFLRNKIRAILSDLWRHYRDPSSNEVPNQLFRYGAFPRTLPRLEVDFPGLLAEIGRTVKEGQKDRWFRENGVMCRCGFTQEIACVCCDKCNTWQHILCYYDTEDGQDFQTHLCDACKGSFPDNTHEKPLSSALKELKIEVQEPRSPCLNGGEDDTVLGPFGFPGDENYFWGPEEPEIQRIMDTVLVNVRRVVYSLMSVGIDRRRTTPAILNDSHSGLGRLLEGALGSSYLNKLQQLLNEEEREGKVMGRMLTGLIMVLVCSKISATTGPKPHCTEALLLNALCHNILSKNGSEVLRDLTRTTLFSMTEERNSGLEILVAADAEEQAKALTSTLVAMIHPRSQKVKGEAPKWAEIFHQVFSIALRLKTRLLLADRLYEFYFPQTGSNSSSSTMTDEARGEVPDGRVVDVCLMPAVIEYEPRSLGCTVDIMLCLLSKGVFVTVTDEQRLKGNVVSPAIVCLQS